MPVLPFFYINKYDSSLKEIELDEETSRHVFTVLRKKIGEQVNLTDGKGHLLTAEIIQAEKRHCIVRVLQSKKIAPFSPGVTIAISLIKNTNRFEWFLEKATEIGINEIIPLICGRTEREHLRQDRMKNVLISAMLQSQQCWLPELAEPVKIVNLDWDQFANNQKFIAHCREGEKNILSDLQIDKTLKRIILIGPEGDFTEEEVALAFSNGCIPVSLGATRLRTETAGMVAAVLLRHS